ncbi:hypothetical protein CCP3SC15_710010 [Gammaproteobacteria bacterium]
MKKSTNWLEEAALIAIVAPAIVFYGVWGGVFGFLGGAAVIILIGSWCEQRKSRKAIKTTTSA